MKDGIRMYHTLFPRKYWILLVYLLFPATIGILGMWCFRVGPLAGTLAGTVASLMLSTTLIVVAEYILDFFMLFGVAAKENQSLEYVKTSVKGIDLLQVALYADGVRRIVTMLASFTVLYAVTRYNFSREAAFITLVNEGETLTCPSVIVFVEGALISLLFVEAGLMITRRIQNALLYILITYALSGFASMIVIFMTQYANGVWIGITTCLLVATWIGSRQYLIRKVRESYYDE